MPKAEMPLRQLRTRTDEEVRRIRSVQIRMMASTHTELKAMAAVLNISVSELRRSHAKDLKLGHDYIYAVISQKMVTQAINGDIRAGLAWMRQFGGWQEVTRREITGKNGEPISFRNLDAHSLTAVLEALSPKGHAGRGPSRIGPEIDLGDSEVVDLDALSRAADEGIEE